MTIDIKLYELEDNGDDNKYRFKIPKGNGLVSGIDRLAQQVAKSLLTTPGSDIRFPNWGGGADGVAPILHDGDEIVTSYTNDIMFIVSKVEQDIKRSQSINPVPDNEALISLTVVDIELTDFDKVTLFLRILTSDRVTTDVTVNL